MNGRAYYNEIDPFAAAWLRELIADGLVPAGDVDERDIRDLLPSDLDRYSQCHFFAGIGGWAYALRLAGWPSDHRVWTGSCPCQPFSAAGRGGGFADERHLWPAFFHLIGECRPAIVFGEQVASKDGLGWLDLVQSDLEGAGYAFGAADLCAAGVGAPHIRQRLFWVADAGIKRHEQIVRGVGGTNDCTRAVGNRQSQYCGAGIMADSINPRLEGCDARALGHECEAAERGGEAGAVGDAGYGERTPSQFGIDRAASDRGEEDNRQAQRAGDMDPWSELIWLPCRDGKARPAQSGIQPLLDGLPTQLARLRSLEQAAWRKIVDHGAASEANPDKVLRMVRSTIRAIARGEEPPTRMLLEFHEAKVLFAFLFCVSAARPRSVNCRRLTKARTEAHRRIVRSVRARSGPGRSSRQWRPDEQRAEQPSDALLALSQLLARDAEAYRETARRAHAASNRVGTLRGAGNAIVPQVAAAFIAASMEASP